MWFLPQNPVMQGKQTAPVHLHRIDPERNMHRFYLLSVQPTLFGGVSVIRNWGRIGSSGQTMVQTFEAEDDAAAALLRVEREKRRKGYREPSL
jgi:predicted DNA-binding WGR domain protein